MPSIRYVNQTAPFWDFVANLEDQGTQHPFFANRDANPWSWAWGPPGPHGTHHHPYGHPHHRHPRGPHPPPHDNGEGPSNQGPPSDSEKGEQPPPSPTGPEGPAGPENHDGPMPHRPHPHHRGSWGGCHNRRGRGGHGPWARHAAAHFGGFMGPFGGIADLMQGINGNNTTNNNESRNEDFSPDADVFDTESAFIVHVSLAGAKREDIGVSWDAEKSELNIGGVIYRPGDEDFLKTLAMDERKVGAFERKVRLGSRANPAQVDADMITAKLEDGVLRVEVPKLDKDYVEVKKVDIE